MHFARGGGGEGEKGTQIWQEGKSRVQVGMGSSDKGLLMQVSGKQPKVLGMRRQLESALQNLGTSQEQKQRAGLLGTSPDPVKRRGRADAPRNRELDLRRHGRRHLGNYLVGEGWD